MDPIILMVVGVGIYFATRKKKSKKKRKKKTPDLPIDGPVEPATPGPIPDPGPFRPGPPIPSPSPDPIVVEPDEPDEPVGPKPWPGPGDGPNPPPQPGEPGDPFPVVVNNDVDDIDIEDFPETPWNIYISADCSFVYEGDLWYDDVFGPAALVLMQGDPGQYHHPWALMWALLVQGEFGDESAAAACLKAWPEFIYGTRGGELEMDTLQVYSEYQIWFLNEYPDLSGFLYALEQQMWADSAFTDVFQAPWDTGGGIPFELEENVA